MQIRPMQTDDAAAVLAIYAEGIATGIATFQTEVPTWSVWDASHLPHCRLVVLNDEQVVGWSALASVSSRYVYRGVAEVSVYIAASARGRGVGKALLLASLEDSERHGFWTLQSVIFAENTASIALHESVGFRQVGYREKLGCLNGVWHDVCLLERRSRHVGVC